MKTANAFGNKKDSLVKRACKKLLKKENDRLLGHFPSI